MKAFKETLGSPSKPETPLSDVKSETTLTGSLWARYRRLEARLSNMESKLSALRRDCDRIEKKQSRESLREPSNSDNGGNQTIKLPDPFVRV